jgi:hypothetical protein
MSIIDRFFKDYKAERIDQQIDALFYVVRSMLLAEMNSRNPGTRLDEFKRLLAMLDDFE